MRPCGAPTSTMTGASLESASRIARSVADPVAMNQTGSTLAFSKRSAPPLPWVEVAVTTTRAPEWKARADSSSRVPSTTWGL
jgi:hypothetical protein